MHLKNIQLSQFKNYNRVQLDFSEEINCLIGINGSGKTNLLDAIHYLCISKSAFNTVDTQNIQHSKQYFTIKGDFQIRDKVHSIACLMETGKKKILSHNDKVYTKMSEHIGLLPLVMIAPDDIQLIKDGSEDRRKFFDSMLSQIDKVYLDNLVRYQHFLKQRNALIRKFADFGRVDLSQLEPYDIELVQLSKTLYKERQGLVEKFRPILIDHYAQISGSKEQVDIGYVSDCTDDDFDVVFKQAVNRDLLLKRTNMGVHKDDFVFTINGYPLKKFGSQGQIKSFLIALKLAQFQLFKETKHTKPILLLDDIFDRLDDLRMGKMMELVANHEFGQLFITDARPERSKAILKTIDAGVKYLITGNGQCRESR